jgi:hypothetical protein
MTPSRPRRILAAEALARLIEQGLPHDQAWELVREEWAFVPEEE